MKVSYVVGGPGEAEGEIVALITPGTLVVVRYYRNLWWTRCYLIGEGGTLRYYSGATLDAAKNLKEATKLAQTYQF